MTSFQIGLIACFSFFLGMIFGSLAEDCLIKKKRINQLVRYIEENRIGRDSK